jgi:hypothetical protein
VQAVCALFPFWLGRATTRNHYIAADASGYKLSSLHQTCSAEVEQRKPASASEKLEDGAEWSVIGAIALNHLPKKHVSEVVPVTFAGPQIIGEGEIPAANPLDESRVRTPDDMHRP